MNLFFSFGKFSDLRNGPDLNCLLLIHLLHFNKLVSHTREQEHFEYSKNGDIKTNTCTLLYIVQYINVNIYNIMLTVCAHD